MFTHNYVRLGLSVFKVKLPTNASILTSSAFGIYNFDIKYDNAIIIIYN